MDKIISNKPEFEKPRSMSIHAINDIVNARKILSQLKDLDVGLLYCHDDEDGFTQACRIREDQRILSEMLHKHLVGWS